MGTILDYIDKYGNKTFAEEPFNEVDSVILTDLSYINFDGIVHQDNRYVTLKETAISFFDKYHIDELKKDGIGLKAAYQILYKIKNYKRYSYMKLYNYYYIGNDNTQFSALMIDVDSKLTFISIEGTDDLVSGWKEDFELSYNFPIKSHKYAIDYLNKHIKIITNRKYIIAGHSKGGNLALVGSMYLNYFKLLHVKKIISYDGPGLRKKEINSYRYKRIYNKYDLIVPNYTVVGLLMNHKDKLIIYKSDAKNILSHNTLTWLVDGNKFIKEDKLSYYSIEIDKIITKWIELYNYDERKKFVDNLFSIFTYAGIKDLKGLNSYNINDIMSIVKNMNNIDNKSRKMFADLFNILINTVKNDTFNYIQDKFVNKNK